MQVKLQKATVLENGEEGEMGIKSSVCVSSLHYLNTEVLHKMKAVLKIKMLAV